MGKIERAVIDAHRHGAATPSAAGLLGPLVLPLAALAALAACHHKRADCANGTHFEGGLCVPDPSHGGIDTGPPDTDTNAGGSPHPGYNPARGSPCADGLYMGSSSPDNLTFVWPYADGDGSLRHPFNTLAEASQAVARRGGGSIAVFPGTYGGGVDLKGRPGESLDLRLHGCSAGETIIENAGTHHDPVAVALEGPGTRDLRGVTIQGSLAIRGGVTATVDSVQIDGGIHDAIQVAGRDTVATVTNLTITARVWGSRNHRGWGISLADGALTLGNVQITSQESYALYAERGILRADGLTISGGDGIGDPAGIYAHAMKSVDLAHCEIDAVTGVGIMLLEVGSVSISDCTIDGVAASAGVTPEAYRPRGDGDGIVIQNGRRPTPSTVALSRNLVRGAARLAIALDGVDAALEGNVTTGNGHDGIYATAESVISGEAAAPLHRGVYPLGRREHPGEGPASFNRPGLPR